MSQISSRLCSITKSSRISLILVYVCSLLSGIKSCELSGSKSGQCLPKADVFDQITFCADYIPPNVCVPYSQSLWFEETEIKSKDKSVEAIFMRNIQTKLIYEYQRYFFELSP